MTIFTETPPNSTLYNELSNDQSTWDNGDTQWDLYGNVFETDWDISTTVWTEI